MEPLLAAAAIGGFIIPFLNTLFLKAANFAQESWFPSKVVVGHVQGIGRTIRKIQVAVGRVEARQVVLNDGLILWLRELKDAVYEADDLLDELNTMVLQLKEERKQQVSNSATDTISLNSKLAKRIKVIREMLDRVANEWGNFKLGELDEKPGYPQIANNRLTSSYVDESKLVGRKEDKEKVIEMLTSYDGCGDKDAFVLPVVGIGGVGKTTLVQLVYNDKRVEQYFHLRMWICVSNEFDARRITGEIVESLPFGRRCKTSNWDMLQTSLKAKLMLNRFLLVLDDVWSDDRVQWENLLAPLVDKTEGSKIVITTRNSSVARIKGMMSPYILEGLSNKDSWSLFTRCAFGGKESEHNLILEEMREEIVEKLDGSPLAAKTLGWLFNSKLEENNWKDILKTEIWQMQQNDFDIMPILKLTYDRLPANLKLCFAFCSILPKGRDLDKDDLVRMWIGQGFIQLGDNKRVEDIGNEYFDDLISRGIFLHKQGKYVMPDLMNDLARFVAMDECSRIESSDESWGLSRSPRHLSLIFRDLNQFKHTNLMNLKGSRTLMFLDTSEFVSYDNLDKLCKNLKSLRVLDLRNTNMEQLPPSIEELKHLRYLNLSDNPIKDLPPSLCKLYNLQTLVLLRCRSLVELPKEMYKLTNLRHLEADKMLTSKIEGIGSLTLLQELEEFKVCENHRIRELREMNELRGCLSIRDLQNVGSGGEAGGAMLADKRHLEILELEWSKASSINTSLNLEVLEKLQPPSDLRTLKIIRYGGISTPKWMKDKMPSHLEMICLHDCPKWQQLPSLGSLHFLKTLDVCEMPGLTSFSGGSETVKFPSLMELRFSNMPEWEVWLQEQNDQYSFPRLVKLVLKNCRKLGVMPPLPPALREITLEGVGLHELEATRGSFNNLLQQPSSYCSLYVSGCPNLRRLHEGFLQLHLLESITSLTISGCANLSYPLPKECFQDFASLKTLRLKECPQLCLAHESSIPLSLKDLEIRSCPLVVNQSVCMALQNHNSASFPFIISNDYNDFDYYFTEVLTHLTKFHSLHIGYEFSSSASSFGISVNFEGRHNFYRCLDMKIRIDDSLLKHINKLSEWLQSLKSLSLLSISGGSKVEYMPATMLQSLTSLTTLVIKECNVLDLLSLQSLCSLEKLRIEDCPSLAILSPGGLLSSSITLLEIIDSPTFIDVLQGLRSLKVLKISSCPGLTSFTDRKEAIVRLNLLQELSIRDCVNLHSLPADLHELNSLTFLRISSCPELQCLPNCVPPSLKRLHIRDCSKLKDRCRKNVGEDWHKIVNVRDRIIE